MRILHVAPTYWPAVRYGGPIWSVQSLCKALVEQGHSVEVVTTAADGPGLLDVPLGQRVDVDGVGVTYYPVGRLRRIFYSAPLREGLRQQMARCDVVHLHYLFNWPTTTAARLAEAAGLPWGVAPRGALIPEMVARKSTLIKKTWLTLFERRTLERAAFLHATSEMEAADAQRFGYALPPCEVVPNGVDLPPSALSYDWPEDVRDFVAGGPVLLFLGRVSWKKGLDRVIPALAQVPQARLLIAGNDDENLTPQLVELARASGVQERIRFLGGVQGERKAALLHCASMLVLPSYSENFGNVVLESLAAARPVAVTPEVALASMVAAEGCGAVVPGEPAALGAALAALLAEPERLSAWGARGRELVQKSYGWAGVAQQMEQVYQRAILRQRGGR